MALLADHPEFDVLIRNIAADLTLRPELVLKDYWVTVILRVLATAPELTGRIIFKGGTSLSKGWRLIDRFSEDIDILTTGPDLGSPPESGGQRGRFLKTIRDAVLKIPRLAIPDIHDPFFYLLDKRQFYAKVRYAWAPSPSKEQASMDTVLLEMGFRGGPNPHSEIAINSLVGEFLLKQGAATDNALSQWKSDFTPFRMNLLDPSQTFMEKLLYLHVALLQNPRDVKTRHLYDVVSIFNGDKSIAELLLSGDYKTQLKGAVDVSNRWYGTTLDADGIDFRTSPILNLTAELAGALEARYADEGLLYFCGQKPFGELMDGLREIRRRFR